MLSDVRAAKLRYRERIESHFQLNDSRRMWQGLWTIGSSGNNYFPEVRADLLLADELNTFYGRFECNGGSATLLISASGSSRQSNDDHVITVSEDKVRRELKWVNCLLKSLMSPSLPLWFPPPLKNLSSSLCLRTINPLAWMTIVQLPNRSTDDCHLSRPALFPYTNRQQQWEQCKAAIHWL